jgi:hypothetical protein
VRTIDISHVEDGTYGPYVIACDIEVRDGRVLVVPLFDYTLKQERRTASHSDYVPRLLCDMTLERSGGEEEETTEVSTKKD